MTEPPTSDINSDDEWSAPFSGEECSSVTPVPYGDLHSVSPYVATPQAAIDLILKQLLLSKEDFLIDLGCGVGTINICAATRFQTAGLGVDIDRDLVNKATQFSEEAGVSNMVRFEVKDVLNTDLSQATAVVSFLVPRHLKLLKTRLMQFLGKGGRLACYHYPLQGVQPVNILQLKEGMDKQIFIYGK
eukprot:GFUD01019550.1.p2 GENE.GFUD01019550.1~~GFUD01019550.1.p2  ORF type:complete len:188 (-),score=54.27 GFUD01019550.1:5-568(-)